MKRVVHPALHWSPRILCILFALFISLFALDVFAEQHGFWHTVMALFMHLIPTFIIVAILLLSWRWEWLGGVVYILIGLFYSVVAIEHPLWILVIAGPAFLIGGLFIINWKVKVRILNELRKPKSTETDELDE